MSPSELSFLTENLLRSALFGLSVLVIVTFFNGAVLIRINTAFSAYCQSSSTHSSLALHMRFIAAVFKLCLVQILAMSLWTAAVFGAGLTENLQLAFMFVGSCFTTLGIVSDVFPTQWQSVAFYIAFSGLFSFALATSVMISLVTEVVKAIPKPMNTKT